jgi:rhodanese-related sulfurtransferase
MRRALPASFSDVVREITAGELRARLDAGEKPVIVDVREAWELEQLRLPGALHIPMGEIADRIGELDPGAETLLLCKSGVRSLHVAHYLADHGFNDAVNVAGGIVAMSRGDDT